MMQNVVDELSELEISCRKRFIPIIGREKGQLLLNLVKEIEPKKILELGTASGYSGIILASQGAELLSVDFDHVSVSEANKNFLNFGVNAKSILAVGEDYIKKLARDDCEQNSFDIIFLDFSKKKYHETFPFCMKLLKKGGYLVADNVKSVYAMDFKRDILNCRNLSTEIKKVSDDEMSFSRKL
jgi:predicted O-methyltransferase YrrM